MMSYAAGLNTNMADEAYVILKELETDPTMEVTIALYNPVSLAKARTKMCIVVESYAGASQS
jgi:hypothetical protein